MAEVLHFPSPKKPNEPGSSDFNLPSFSADKREPSWKQSFTDEKVGPLSDDELDHIMSSPASWEQPVPAKKELHTTLPGMADVIDDLPSRRVRRQVLVDGVHDEWGKAFDDSRRAPEIDDYTHDAVLTPKSARNQEMTSKEQETLRDQKAGLSEMAQQLGKEASEMLRHTSSVEKTETGDVTTQTTELSPDLSISEVTDPAGNIIDIITISNEETHEIHKIVTTGPDEPEVLIDQEPVDTLEKTEQVKKVLEEAQTDIDASASTPESNEDEAVIVPEVATQPHPETVHDALSISDKMKNAIVPYIQNNPAAREAMRNVGNELGLSEEDISIRLTDGQFNTNKSAIEALKLLNREGAKPGSEVWNADPHSQSMMSGARAESQKLLENTLRKLLSEES